MNALALIVDLARLLPTRTPFGHESSDRTSSSLPTTTSTVRNSGQSLGTCDRRPPSPADSRERPQDLHGDAEMRTTRIAEPCRSLLALLPSIGASVGDQRELRRADRGFTRPTRQRGFFARNRTGGDAVTTEAFRLLQS